MKKQLRSMNVRRANSLILAVWIFFAGFFAARMVVTQMHAVQVSIEHMGRATGGGR